MNESGRGRTGHLEAEELAGYLDRALDQAELRRVEAHLESCAACRREMVEAGRVLDTWIPTGSARHDPAPRRRRAMAGTAAALLLAASLAAILIPPLDSGLNDTPPLRDPAPSGVEGLGVIPVLGPGDGASVDGPVEFAWRPSGALQYRLRLTDASGSILWNHGTADTTAILPADVTLRPGEFYFWHVDGVTDGVSSTTRMHRFSVIR